MSARKVNLGVISLNTTFVNFIDAQMVPTMCVCVCVCVCVCFNLDFLNSIFF